MNSVATMNEKSIIEGSSHENNGKMSIISKICLSAIFVCALLTGFVPQLYLSLFVIFACVPMMGTKDIYLVYPIMLFYYAHFGMLFGLSVYRLFTFMFLISVFIYNRNIKFKLNQLLPFAVFLFYCLIVIVPYNVRQSFFAIVDLFCILVLINTYLKDTSSVKKFFKIYVLISLVAYVTGMNSENVLESSIQINGKWVDISRNLATFEDPNYMGFFYTVGIFAMTSLRLFNPKVRVGLIAVLYYMILSSISFTALVVNALLWILYFVLAKKLTLKVFLGFIGVALVLYGLYLYGMNNPDSKVFGAFFYRISEKTNSFVSDDLSDVTSGRLGLAAEHMNFFLNQPIYRMLVGLNAASTLKTDLNGSGVAGHNEYVDMLLNIGIIGTVIMMSFIISRCVNVYRRYASYRDEKDACILLCKFAWLAYATTLTVFGDFRFMLTFFI